MPEKTLLHAEGAPAITFEKCPGCTARIRASDGVILYPHDSEDCRLSNAYSHAPTDDERDRVAAAMQAKLDLETGQTCEHRYSHRAEVAE